MTTCETSAGTAGSSAYAPRVRSLGIAVTHSALILVLGWVGAMKFTAYEAEAISGLVASSPLTSWLDGTMSVRQAASLIGVVELITAALLVIGFRNPAACALGTLMAAGTFALTLSFLLTAPVFEASLGGFPALNVLPGQFLLKDAVLLGAALWLLAHSLDRLGPR